MGRNILVINVDIRETRVALIENGIIAELHLERESSKGTLGNIYLGKVSRVLPGMQAAFIDVGLERAAFLHVEDLIRPDDFEAYLQGHRRGSEEERETRSSDDDDAAPIVERRPIDALREEDDDAPLVADRPSTAEAVPAFEDDDEDEPRADGIDGDADEEEPRADVIDGDADEAAFAAEEGSDEGGAQAASEIEGEAREDADVDDERADDERADDERDEDRDDADADEDDADRDDEEREDDLRDEERDDEPAEDEAAGAADFASAEAASGDFASEPIDEGELTATPIPEDRPSAELAGDASAPEAEASDPGASAEPFEGEPPEGEGFVEGADAELPGEAGAAEPAGDAALVAVPEGDTEITVAQQRRRRGGRRDRVRRSRSTRDRMPEAAVAAPEAAPPAEAPPQRAPRDPNAPRGQRDSRAPQPREGRGQRGQDRPQQDRPQGGGREGGRNDRGRRDDRRRDNREERRRGQAQQGAQPQAAQNQGRRDDRGRRDGRRPEGRDAQKGQARDARNLPARTAGRGRNYEPPRISKTTPIREVVREGQEVLVQISKEPIGTKGARVTSHISLPGRYVVYLPTVDHVGISKRIGSEKERSRLREAIDSMKPPQGGLIVRTVAEGLTKKQLKADVGYLVRLWGEVVKKRESGQRAPVCLYSEVDLILKTARDLFTDDIEKIVIDSREEYFRLRKFIEMFMPERIDAIELYEGEEPIFDAYGIEDEIQRALARKVPLPSGGYLIIDQAEALTAIDVNTGRFVGKGSKDLEETILATNLEAVEEIAYQLRFRNIGGLIILDLIDMERAQNREKVRRRMEELLSKDKAKTTLNRISELGLIEMTRKRTRESLGRTILEPCFYCDGTGQLQSKQTIAYEILRQIRRERMNLPGYSIIVNAHPAIIDLLKNDEREAVTEAERIFQRRIDLVPRKEYHLEQFDLQGK